MPNKKIFLSYGVPDRPWAEELAEALRSLGADVWFDQWSVHPGDNLADAIEQGLRQADFIVFVLSPETVHRPNLYFELGAAVGMGKRVAAVVPETVGRAELPAPLLTRKYIAKASPEETAKALVVSGENSSGTRKAMG
jgi:hypothetical protein